MSDIERLRKLAHNEIDNHRAEADRLTGLAHDLLKNADWHLSQAGQWCNYLGTLASENLAEIIPLQRGAHLRLVEGQIE